MSSSQSESEGSGAADEAWRDYPVWLQPAVKDDASEKTVRILDASTCGEFPDPVKKRVRVRSIKMPDTLQHAAGEVKTWYTIQEGSVILVTAGPDVQPYIGLVMKIHRDQDAAYQVRDGVKWYSSCNFFLDIYYFYRSNEAPRDAKGRREAEKGHQPGGVMHVAASSVGKLKRLAEEGSERQLMFSNHASWTDTTDDICAESFLLTTKVHWLLEREKIPVDYYEAADGKLYQRMAPGFVVRFFNFYSLPVSQGGLGRVYGLSEEWPDKATRALVEKLRRSYLEEEKARTARNDKLLEKHRALCQQQQQQQQVPASPRLLADDSPDKAAALAQAPLSGVPRGAGGAALLEDDDDAEDDLDG